MGRRIYIEKLTHEERVLEMFKRKKWVNGLEFLELEQPLSQYHARMWGLQQKGYEFEGKWVRGSNHMSYRLIKEPRVGVFNKK